MRKQLALKSRKYIRLGSDFFWSGHYDRFVIVASISRSSCLWRGCIRITDQAPHTFDVCSFPFISTTHIGVMRKLERRFVRLETLFRIGWQPSKSEASSILDTLHYRRVVRSHDV